MIRDQGGDDVFIVQKGTILREAEFGHSVDVGNVPIRLGKKDIAAISGPSGSGKTVFLKALLSHLAMNHSFSIAYVAQDAIMLPETSVRINGMLRSRSIAFTKVLSILPVAIRNHVKSRRKWSGKELSGGQARAFCLCAAIGRRPTLLVLDETMSSMDASLRKDSLRIVASAIEQGYVQAAIIVTHDQDVLSSLNIIWEISSNDGQRSVRVINREGRFINTEDNNSSKEPTNNTSAQEKIGTQGRKGNMFAWLSIASLAAIAATLILIAIPPLFSKAGRTYFLPRPTDLIEAATTLQPAIRSELFEAICLSLLAIVLGVALSLMSVLIILPWRARLRNLFLAVIIALQGIPTLVFARTLRTQCVLSGETTIVLIAVMFFAFPLVVTWTRIASAVPHGFLWMHGRPRLGWHAVIASLWALGQIMRVIVTCSPLAAIGVVVGGYLASDSGLGYRMFIAMTNNSSVSDRWIWAITCAALSCIVLVITSVLCKSLLPKDVDCV